MATDFIPPRLGLVNTKDLIMSVEMDSAHVDDSLLRKSKARKKSIY